LGDLNREKSAKHKISQKVRRKTKQVWGGDGWVKKSRDLEGGGRGK